MIRNFDSNRRDNTRPSSRGQSSGRYGDSRPPRPARPRLNRETVDRAWENGASRDHADYHPRSVNGRSSPQRRPYERDSNAPSSNNRRSYPQGGGAPRYGNQGRSDARPSSRPYGDRRDSGNRRFNDNDRPYGNRQERSHGYASNEQRPYRRYEDNRAPGGRYGENNTRNQRPPRRYDDERSSGYRPPRREYDDRAPSQRPPRRFENDRTPDHRPPRRDYDDRTPDRQPPRRDYDDRTPRQEYRRPANGKRRDSEAFQFAEDDSAEDGSAEAELFTGDYEQFNEISAPSPAKRTAPTRQQRKQHTTWSKQPKDKAMRAEQKPRAKSGPKPARQKPKRAKGRPEPATRPWQKGYKWPAPSERHNEE